VKEWLVFPSQWNCYHLSSEWQLSGTPETMEYHEAFKKDINFCKDSLRDKTVHSWNWTYDITVTQGCFLKVTLGINLVSTNQWRQIEQQISHTYTHTHTMWWYPNRYLINEFLNFYLLNSHVELDQISLNTRTPWCIPSILTVLKTDFDSSSLMHA
jgi:hypothetical protein